VSIMSPAAVFRRKPHSNSAPYLSKVFGSNDADAH
jgi:hypothetical protein